jgi:hypothetical protein
MNDKNRIPSAVILIALLCILPATALATGQQLPSEFELQRQELEKMKPVEPSPTCSQPSAEREALMRRAEKMRFTLRRLEFVGNTYTPDQVLRRRTAQLQEGEFFSRRKVINSLRNVSKLRNEIYPAKLSDVELRLNESEQTVDMTICFRPKRSSSSTQPQ